MNKKKTRSNKKAIIVILIFTTFFTIGSFCGIFSCASQCSKPIEAHADVVLPDRNTYPYDASMTFSNYLFVDFLNPNDNDVVYRCTDVSFLTPVVFRYGKVVGSGDERTLFQIGSCLPANAEIGSILTVQDVISSSYVFFDIKKGYNFIPFVCYAGYVQKSSETSGYNDRILILGLEFFVDNNETALDISSSVSGFSFSQVVDFSSSTLDNNTMTLTCYFNNVNLAIPVKPITMSLPDMSDILMSVSLNYSLVSSNQDLSDSLTNEFNAGYESGRLDGYSEGYRQGEIAGFNRGSAFSERPTFKQLFDSIVYVPVKTIVSLFNFELLGTNMLDFVTALATVVALLGIVRLIL